jgi:uncharacterized protein YgfB (UPF0149 family)
MLPDTEFTVFDLDLVDHIDHSLPDARGMNLSVQTSEVHAYGDECFSAVKGQGWSVKEVVTDHHHNYPDPQHLMCISEELCDFTDGIATGYDYGLSMRECPRKKATAEREHAIAELREMALDEEDEEDDDTMVMNGS